MRLRNIAVAGAFTGAVLAGLIGGEAMKALPALADQFNSSIYTDQLGVWHIGNNGLGQVESGGKLNIASGGKLEFGGVDQTAALSTAPAAVAAGYKIARGQATTATASDTVVTGLALVTSCTANLDAGPTTDPEMATCSVGNQSGAPAAGSVLIQTWKTLGSTPAASATFSKVVDWQATGN